MSHRVVATRDAHGYAELGWGIIPNAEDMDLFQLQQLMQHKSLETTRRYVSMAHRLNRAVDGLYVPDVLKAKAGSA